MRVLMDFDAWCAELDRLAAAEGCENYTAQTGRDVWMDAFNDSLTPQEAWADEKAAGYEG